MGRSTAKRAVWASVPVALLLGVGLSVPDGGPAEPPLPQDAIARRPDIRIEPETGMRELRLSVLTYNIAALPWPVRRGRGEDLARIGAYLGALREEGREPDVVLLQEAFAGPLDRLIRESGYPNMVRGPQAGDEAAALDSPLARQFRSDRRYLRGEGWGRLLGGGLYILSNYSIEAKQILPFRHCAGWDCLAGKGALLARIRIPGLPQPVDILNTHLNSRLDAGVPYERSRIAHNLQIDELDRFIAAARAPGAPLIFGGDFNIRGSKGRIDYALAKDRPYRIVRHHCIAVSRDCEIALKVTHPEPWRDAQDLQGFHDGSGISVEPVRIEALFDGPATGGILSDHEGFLVHYRLRWHPQGAPVQTLGGAEGS